MTEDELVMLEQMCDAATPGPWVADEYEEGLDDPTGLVYVWARDSWPCLADCDCAPFIAAAREWLPKLIAEVRRLQTENAKLEEQCHPSRYHDVEEYYRETTGD